MTWQPDTLKTDLLVNAVKDTAIAAGWGLFDVGVTSETGLTVSWCVISKNFSDGPYLDEMAYVKINCSYSSPNFNLTTALHYTWDASTHTGSAAAYTSDNNQIVCAQTTTGKLWVAADAAAKFLWVSGQNYLNQWLNYTGVVGCIRFPWDLMDYSTTTYKTNRAFYISQSTYDFVPSWIAGATTSSQADRRPVIDCSYPSSNNLTILSDIYLSVLAKHPTMAALQVNYPFGKVASMKMLPAVGKDSLSLVTGTLLPSAAAPEWMVVKEKYAIPWCNPNMFLDLVA